MKILSATFCTNILKQCERFKNSCKIPTYYFLRLRLGSGILIIILFHILKISAAEENAAFFNEDEIAYADKGKNSTENGILDAHSLEEGPKTKNGDDKRYKIANIEFQRVETPVLITMWIFCASLAKICESV